ncbi:MAG: hypothetical protein GY870_09275 [archaeon]|nr:hypothetical protein [archaeon]
MINHENELESIKMMKHTNGIDFTSTTLFCKCQACNNIAFKPKPLKKGEIEKMFEKVKEKIQ